MGKIQGSQVSEFEDRKIKVSIRLNRDVAGNANKFEPVMLFNTYRIDLPNKPYIGNACVAAHDAALEFNILSSAGICGIQPQIKSIEEIISDGNRYWTTSTRYSLVTSIIRTYSKNDQLIMISNFQNYSKEEAFRRYNLEITVNEILSYTTMDGKTYPTAGLEADVLPAPIAPGEISRQSYAGAGDIKIGRELGAMSISMYQLKDKQAFEDLVTKVPGLTPNMDW